MGSLECTMVAPKLWTIAILVCALALTASVQAHQTLQWASFNRADQNSVQIKPVAQHHVLSTGGSVYSVFSHQDQATLHDVGLKVRLLDSVFGLYPQMRNSSF